MGSIPVSLCRFIQIEHRTAIEHLEEIVQNPYIDGYIFGPNDLSGSYDMPGNVFSDRITDTIQKTIQYLHQKGKYTGIASGSYSEDVIRHWSKLGADMLTAGADFDFLRDGALKNRNLLEQLHINQL